MDAAKAKESATEFPISETRVDDFVTDEAEMVRARLEGELEWLSAHRGTLEVEAQMYTLELEAFLRKFGVDYMPHAALALSIVARELELDNLEAPTTPKVAE